MIVVEASKYISCVGVDDKMHICLPDSDICHCGVKVKRKKVLRDDWKLFCCVECDYVYD